MIDRSLLAHEQRQRFLQKKSEKSAASNCLVWIQSKEGEVFGACIPLCLLGLNGVTVGDHQGLLWWPQEI